MNIHNAVFKFTHRFLMTGIVLLWGFWPVKTWCEENDPGCAES